MVCCSMYVNKYPSSIDKLGRQNVLKWADGGRYNGEWNINRMHGRGLLTWKTEQAIKNNLKIIKCVAC